MTGRVGWARALQAIAQSGLTYAESPFDRQRYEAVRAVAAEIAAATAGEQPELLLARFADEVGHATPKVVVRGVVVADGEVLLVREAATKGWNLPGGWAEVGETPSQAVEKEVREETGVRVRATRLLAITSRDLRHRPRWPVHVWNVYVACAPVGERTPRPDGLEIVEAAWFPVGRPPPLSKKTPRARLVRALELVANTALPADFE